MRKRITIELSQQEAEFLILRGAGLFDYYDEKYCRVEVLVDYDQDSERILQRIKVGGDAVDAFIKISEEPGCPKCKKLL